MNGNILEHINGHKSIIKLLLTGKGWHDYFTLWDNTGNLLRILSRREE